MSRTKRSFVVLGVTTLALFSSTAGAGATPGVVSEPSCVTVVKKVPGKNKTEVVSNQCSADPSSLRRPTDSNLLVTFYADANYGIPFSEVRADDGPCDSEGYGLSDLDDINDEIGISSYIIGSDCNEQIYYDDTDFDGSASGHLNDNPWVGEPWNDNLLSMQLWHS